MTEKFPEPELNISNDMFSGESLFFSTIVKGIVSSLIIAAVELSANNTWIGTAFLRVGMFSWITKLLSMKLLELPESIKALAERIVLLN
jgi:hypothetical protein